MISKVLVKAPVERSKTASEFPPVQPGPPPKKIGRGLLKLAVVSVAAAAAYFFVPWGTISVTSLTSLWSGGKPIEAPPPRPIPVVAVPAHVGDMNLNLNGLGNVTALYSVILKSRVDGELIKVAFTEGQVVNKGDLLAEIDPRPYEVMKRQLQGQLLKDEAALKIAQLNLDRYTALLPNRTVTQQQVDEQIALVKQCEGAIEADQASIKNIDLQLQYCKIVAPIPGTIGLRLVDPGNMVKANDPTGMAVINQLQPITVVFTIPQDDIARIQRQINAGVQLKVDAYDRDFKNKLATGDLMALDNQVDVTTGTVRLKAKFSNEDHMLFPNQFVNARLLVDTIHDAVIVPAPAVQQGPKGTFVYVVGKDSQVEVRDVTVGATEADQTVIKSGLADHELVVVDGVDKLRQGTKVALRENSRSGEGGSGPVARADKQGT
ncbi:MAG TPA: efflux RND transporter periplasmic adaptor subunit [Pirellulales bacterium]|nr:efflux RND transporter periplasmic adaptor subunit [Pirellulales bacterium]